MASAPFSILNGVLAKAPGGSVQSSTAPTSSGSFGNSSSVSSPITSAAPISQPQAPQLSPPGQPQQQAQPDQFQQVNQPTGQQSTQYPSSLANALSGGTLQPNLDPATLIKLLQNQYA